MAREGRGEKERGYNLRRRRKKKKRTQKGGKEVVVGEWTLSREILSQCSGGGMGVFPLEREIEMSRGIN